MESKKRLRRTCEFCGNIYNVRSVRDYKFSDMDENMVMFTDDPFAAEIHGDLSKHWICDSCAYESSMEI